MKRLLIALMTIGLLGVSPLTMADPDRNESGFLKAHDRHDGYLSKRVHREHPGYRGRGHYKHKHHKYRHHKGPKWHHRERHNGRHYRDDRHHYRDGHYKHRRSYRGDDRNGAFFGIADGDRGVLIWNK